MIRNPVFQKILAGIVLVLVLGACSTARRNRGPLPETGYTGTALPAPTLAISVPVSPAVTDVPDAATATPGEMEMEDHSHMQAGTPPAAEMEMPGVESTPAVQEQHVHIGPHILMAEAPEETAADRQQAAAVAEEARQALGKYADYREALKDGYQILASNIRQDVYHFYRFRDVVNNMDLRDPTRPTALLYRKVGPGWEWAGVMYSASWGVTPQELDEIFPRSLGGWHAHVNICAPSSSLDWDRLVGDPKFGFDGSIATRSDCQAAGGQFLEHPLGWMVHVLW